MHHPFRFVAAILLLVAGGCGPSAPSGAAVSTKLTPTNPANSAYVTVEVDSASGRSDLADWLMLNGVRVEKSPNGDDRIFDSPGCRRALVQYRRMLRVRMDVISQNLLNINTTHDAQGRNIPYQRKYVSRTGEIGTDDSPTFKRYEPGHPDADSDGYVNYPNIDRSVELVELWLSSRVYNLVAEMLQRFDPTYVTVDLWNYFVRQD